jgi:hypothetical protein
LDILAPKRPASSVTDNLTIDVPLNIGPGLSAASPVFWHVIAKYRSHSDRHWASSSETNLA